METGRDALSTAGWGQSVNPQRLEHHLFFKRPVELFNHVGIFVRHVVRFAGIGFEVVEFQRRAGLRLHDRPITLRAACATFARFAVRQ